MENSAREPDVSTVAFGALWMKKGKGPRIKVWATEREPLVIVAGLPHDKVSELRAGLYLACQIVLPPVFRLPNDAMHFFPPCREVDFDMCASGKRACHESFIN